MLNCILRRDSFKSMSILRNKASLKTSFKRGDTITENNMEDLIDSYANLSETNLQEFKGEIATINLSASDSTIENLSATNAIIDNIESESIISTDISSGDLLSFTGTFNSLTSENIQVNVIESSSNAVTVTKDLTIYGDLSSTDIICSREVKLGDHNGEIWNSLGDTRGYSTNSFGVGQRIYLWSKPGLASPESDNPQSIDPAIGYSKQQTNIPFVVRRDTTFTTIASSIPTIALYNGTGVKDSTVHLCFASQEIALEDVSGPNTKGNSVPLAGIIAKKDTIGQQSGWCSGSLHFYTKNIATRQDVMTMTNTGRVGVRTSDPSHTLTVAGSVSANDIHTNNINLYITTASNRSQTSDYLPIKVNGVTKYIRLYN